jgi:hypothetical protein
VKQGEETGDGFLVGAPLGASDWKNAEQPFLPQRAPTFAKATAGKQSFTARQSRNQRD